MKKIIAISFLILILTLFYYPIFDNEKISYLIIFSCLVAISFAGAKIYTPNDNYDWVEKEMDRLHKEEGIFQYTSDGFYIKQKYSMEFIKWIEIIEINSFSIPVLYHEKQTGIEIVTIKKNYEFYNKDTVGIEKLVDELYNNLPNWQYNFKTIKINNFGLEKTRLYERENIKF